jgi:hypothetical protein
MKIVKFVIIIFTLKTLNYYDTERSEYILNMFHQAFVQMFAVSGSRFVDIHLTKAGQTTEWKNRNENSDFKGFV